MDRLSNPWRLFRDLDIAKSTHLALRNRLDSFVSLQLATLNHAFTSHYGDYEIGRISIDYEQCKRWFALSEQRDTLIRDTAKRHAIRRVEIEYLELCNGPAKVLRLVRHSTVPADEPTTEAEARQAVGHHCELLGTEAAVRRHAMV